MPLYVFARTPPGSAIVTVVAGGVGSSVVSESSFLLELATQIAAAYKAGGAKQVGVVKAADQTAAGNAALALIGGTPVPAGAEVLGVAVEP